MKTIDLKVEKREKLGKGAAKRLRWEEQIPAVLYGSKLPPIPLTVDMKAFQKAVKAGGGNVILNLKIGTAKKGDAHTALVKAIQLNPVTDAIDHVDFHAISLTEKIRVKVPLHEKGESAGVKEGGVLEHVHREIEVECLPTEIPERFDVEISHLLIGDAVHVKDLTFPAGVTCLLDPEEVVLTVIPPMKEEVPVAAEEAPAEPEVIGKKKEEVEGEEAAAKPEKAEKPEKEKEKEKG